MAYSFLGIIDFYAGKPENAIRAIETFVQLMGRSPFALGILGSAYAVTGRAGEACKILEELRARAQKEYVPSWAFAVIHSGLGEIDGCFDWLEKAADEQEGVMLHSHIDPSFDLMRSHPRYAALLRRMNLSP